LIQTLCADEQFKCEALFFGDFLLDQQKKVTRPPAGTGALSQATVNLAGNA
jgi:hypothetical protein